MAGGKRGRNTRKARPSEGPRIASQRNNDTKNEGRNVFRRVLSVTMVVGLLGTVAVVLFMRTSPKQTRRQDTKPITTKQSPIIVGGYLPDYRFYIDVNATAKHMTDLILFSIAADDRPFFGSCCLRTSQYEIARAAREYKMQLFSQGSHAGNGLRLLITVGGGGRSNSFASIAADDGRRGKFISNLKSLCLRESMDGVDFDWEQPRNQEEYLSYMHFLVEAAASFHSSGLLVTVALHPKQFLLKEVYQIVDRIHLMTYDMMAAPEKRTSAGGFHHAAFDEMVGAVDEFLSHGCPNSKIALGIPAYARHSQNPGMVKTYAEIVDSVSDSAGSALSFDSLSDLDSFDGYRFDSPSVVRRKVLYAKEKNLAGVFFWEIGQDKQLDRFGDGGILLQSASHAANGKPMVLESVQQPEL